MRRTFASLLLGALLASCCRTAAPAGGAGAGAGTEPEAPGARPAAEAPQPAEAVPPPADPDERATCPVCGLEFRAGEARAAATHAGRTYRFLLPDHADAFRRDPSRYLPADAGRP